MIATLAPESVRAVARFHRRCCQRDAPSRARRTPAAARARRARHPRRADAMLAYLVRRIVFGAAVLIGTSIITFVIAFVVPADPAVAMAGREGRPANARDDSARAGPRPAALCSVRALPRSRDSRRPRPLLHPARERDAADRRSLSRDRDSRRRRDGVVADSRHRDGRARGGVSRAAPPTMCCWSYRSRWSRCRCSGSARCC